MRKDITAWLFFLFFLRLVPAGAQQIVDVDFEVINDRVRVTYRITGCRPDRAYDVELWVATRDGDRFRARSVRGDLAYIECGDKPVYQIWWDVLQDRPSLIGQVQVEVRITGRHSTKERWPVNDVALGLTIGGFFPLGSFTDDDLVYETDNLEQGGMKLELSYYRTYHRLAGISGSAFVSWSKYRLLEEPVEETAWANWGLVLGPMVTLPFNETDRIYFRYMFGYAITLVYPGSPSSLFYTSNFSSGDIYSTAFATQAGITLKIDNYSIGIDYLRTRPEFSNLARRDMRLLNISVGLCFSE